MRTNPLFFLLLVSVSLLTGRTSLKAIDLENGTYAVGFRHYKTFDSSRTYNRLFDWNNKSTLRPILTSVWYPGSPADSEVKPLSVLRYLEILKEEEEWEHLPNEHILNWFYYANTRANQKHLAETTTARPEIEAAKGKFPSSGLCAQLSGHFD